MNSGDLIHAREDSPLGSLPLTVPLPEEPRLVGTEYVLLDRLGEGGMGEVWRARQLSTGRTVAIKLMRRGIPEARFAQEVGALAKLDHPGIVRLLQAGQHEGRPFLVLELVTGPSVAQLLAHGRMEPRIAARTVQEAAEALAAGHAGGLVHRDLKPGNLLRDAQGRIRVTDFGLAKDLNLAQAVTVTGEQIGTPNYMAPEQVDSRLGPISPATDVYGLGATLFHCLTGRPPFSGTTPAEIMHQVSVRSPDWHNGWQKIHRDLKTIGQRAMQREAGSRYPSAAELGADLGRFLAGEPILARPISVLERIRHGIRKPWPLAVASSLLLTAALTWLFRPADQRTAAARLLSAWPQQSPAALHVLDMPSGSGAGRQVSFSPDGLRMAVGGAGQYVRVASLQPWKLVSNGLRHRAGISFHAFLEATNQPGSRQLLTVDDSGTWRRWLVEPVRRLALERSMQSKVTAVALAPVGDMFALGNEVGRFEVWWDNGTNHRRKFHHQEGAFLTALQFDREARRLLAACADGHVCVWDLELEQPVREWRYAGENYGAMLSPDGVHLAIACQWKADRESLLRICRIADGAEVGTNRFAGRITEVKYSPDGSRLAAASSRRWAEIWTASARPLARTGEHPEPVQQVEFSPDGLRLLTVDRGGNARVWDAHTGEPLTLLWRGVTGIQEATFAPDGIRVGSGDLGPTGTLWDVSCPVPVGWDRQSLVRALSLDGRVAALRRAAWLAPEDSAVWQRLSAATEDSLPGTLGQLEATFLRTRGRASDSVPE
jgi:hypothetical protein